jgi:hypothetical protein
MPALEGSRAAFPRLESSDRVKQLLVKGLRTEMLTPQRKPEFTGEDAGSVSEAAIKRRIGMRLVVDHRAHELGIVRPRPQAEIVRADRSPDVVDHADLGVDIYRPPSLGLEVIDGHPVSAGCFHPLYGLQLAHTVWRSAQGTVAIWMARKDCDEPNPRRSS